MAKYSLSSLVRSATACVLVLTLCALTFPMAASADEHNIASPYAWMQVRFDSPVTWTWIPQNQAASPRWTLLPEPSWLTVAPSSSNFLSSGRTAESARLADSSFAHLAPTFVLTHAVLVTAEPQMQHAMPQSSSESGHGHWLALGVVGLVVAGVGAVAYAGEQESICGGSRSPGKGCSEVKTAGLVLMPVGAVMAVVGFVKYAHH